MFINLEFGNKKIMKHVKRRGNIDAHANYHA
jgi:hypothetical protein